MKAKKRAVMIGCLFVILLLPELLLAGGQIVLKDVDGQNLMTVKGNDLVQIGTQPYHFQSWGYHRLKLVSQSSHQGVFLKRLGVKLIIRNLKGDILHIIWKEGFVFKVDSPEGDTLMFMKISSPQKVTLFRELGKNLFVVTAKGQTVAIKDASGQTLYTLKGTDKTFPASFLCLSDLSWEERVACFLLYEKIPFPYE